MKDQDPQAIFLSCGNIDAKVLDYGAITQSIRFRGSEVLLGYEDAGSYLSDPFYMGAFVGPLANRLKGSAFDLDGEVYRFRPNEGVNLLHSGDAGLSGQYWDILDQSRSAIWLRLVSKEGASGFPGDVTYDLQVFIWNDSLTYQMTAQTTAATPISLAQHNYYQARLGAKDVELSLNAEEALDVDEALIPNGQLRPIDPEELNGARDIDSACVVSRGKVASLKTPEYRMDVFSNQPSLQVYSGSHLSDPFEARSGLCLEPQGFPNAINQSEFPSVVVQPGEIYRFTKILSFS